MTPHGKLPIPPMPATRTEPYPSRSTRRTSASITRAISSSTPASRSHRRLQGTSRRSPNAHMRLSSQTVSPHQSRTVRSEATGWVTDTTVSPWVQIAVAAAAAEAGYARESIALGDAARARAGMTLGVARALFPYSYRPVIEAEANELQARVEALLFAPEAVSAEILGRQHLRRDLR